MHVVSNFFEIAVVIFNSSTQWVKKNPQEFHFIRESTHRTYKWLYNGFSNKKVVKALRLAAIKIWSMLVERSNFFFSFTFRTS